MKGCIFLAIVVLCFAFTQGKVYHTENFDGGFSKWVHSSWKSAESSAGKFNHTAGKWFGDAKDGLSLQTAEDYRFYTTSTKMTHPFLRKQAGSADKKTLVLQYSVKHEQNWIECGGGYIKVFPAGLVQKDMNNESPASIVFGPDLCGTQTKDVLVTFRAGKELFPIKKHIRCESNKLTHFYTLIVNPDDSYEVRIDNSKKESGKLSEDFSFPSNSKLAIDEKDIAFLGIEIWQVRGGSLFDNFLVTDNVAEAEAVINNFDDTSRAAEKSAFEEADRLQQIEEDRVRKAIEEERKKQDEELATRMKEADPSSAGRPTTVPAPRDNPTPVKQAIPTQPVKTEATKDTGASHAKPTTTAEHKPTASASEHKPAAKPASSAKDSSDKPKANAGKVPVNKPGSKLGGKGKPAREEL
jgi:hypothetical protein